MSFRAANAAAAALILASFACLAPGLARPALSLDISPVLPFLGKVDLYHQTRSILGTVRNLYETGNLLVAGLILLFSVIVPCAKGLALLYALAFRRAPGRRAVRGFVALIGKWSMADVFVMGIFLAYLAAGSANGVSATLHDGFWWFLAACLLSVASAQIMRLDPPAAEREEGQRSKV
jgi:paraquat-inducible protein A